MKYNIGFIIFVVMIVANVIGGIMKKRAEQQKLAKLSNSRAQRTAAARSTQSSPAMRTGNAVDRAEQLAARRKAQLDELRSRRQRRAGSQQLQQQQQPQTRIGSSSSSIQPKSFRPPTAPQPTPVKTSRVVTRPSTQPKQAPVSRSSMKSKPSAPIRADTQRLRGLKVSEGILSEPLERISGSPTRITPTSSILDTGDLTPELLRRMVVLKEIFDRPVALRDSEIWDRL